MLTIKGFLPAGDQDDIVLQTFKQQQKAYRALLEGLKVGLASPGVKTDIMPICENCSLSMRACMHARRRSRCP